MDWIAEWFLLNVLGAIFQLLFHWPGWLALRVITLGRYPPPRRVPYNRAAVAMFGFTVLVLALTFLSRMHS